MFRDKVLALWPKGGREVGQAVSVKAAYAFGEWPPERKSIIEGTALHAVFVYESDKPIEQQQPEPPLEITGVFDGIEWKYSCDDCFRIDGTHNPLVEH